VSIPDEIAGKTIPEATAILEDLGLTVDATTGTIDSPTVPKDFVADTSPAGIGESVPHGATVQLLISTGPKLITVPAFRGMTEEQALQAIEAAPFRLAGDVIRQFNAEIPAGIVVDVLGADGASILDSGQYGELQEVTLIVSAGALPDVTGKTVEEAIQILAGVNLTAEPGKEDYNNTVPAGAVVGIDPEPNAEGVNRVFRQGDRVSLIISRGPDLVTIPEDIEDMTLRQAVDALTELGFVPIVDTNIPEIFWDLPASEVDSTSPGPGEQAIRGSEVTVVADA
jgi:serine/threonine-protein kinase